MEHHSASYFSEKNSGPVVGFGKSNDPETPWPFTIKISDGETIGKGLDIHVGSEIDLIKFKNSVLDAYREHCIRERGRA